MKNLIKFVTLGVVILLISSAAYAKKDNDGKKADKEKQKASDAASKQKQDVAKEAKKDRAEEKAEKAGRESEDKVKDVNAAGEKKKPESKKLFGFAWGKNHQQQLKALDEKAAKAEAKNKEKIAALEKELAAAQAANNKEETEKLEKKLAQTKQTSEEQMKKIEAERTKIKAKMEKKK